jgi:hypothetical protein
VPQDDATGQADHMAVRMHGPDGTRLSEPHMTAEQVAALFGITARTVRKYARAGEWPHMRSRARGGGIYLFCTHDLDAIALSMTNGNG